MKEVITKGSCTNKRKEMEWVERREMECGMKGEIPSFL